MRDTRTLHCCVAGLGRFGMFWFELLYKQRKVLHEMGSTLIHRENVTTVDASVSHTAYAPVSNIEFLLYDPAFSKEMHTTVQKICDTYTATEEDGATHTELHASVTTELSIATKDMLALADVIFLCMPISVLETQATELLSYCHENVIVFDTCSVKEKPVQWINAARKATQYFMATHPLFGPDSFEDERSRKIVLSAVHMTPHLLVAWEVYFTAIGLHCLQLSPAEHDKQIAYTQGLTHLVGRILKHIPQQSYTVSTKGFLSLQEIISQTCNDSAELFLDLQVHNQYSAEVWNAFSHAYETVLDTLHKSERGSKE